MEELEYWKIKSQILQLRLEEAQIEAMFVDLTNRKSALLQKIGLNGNLRFNDEQFTIEEIKNV